MAKIRIEIASRATRPVRVLSILGLRRIEPRSVSVDRLYEPFRPVTRRRIGIHGRTNRAFRLRIPRMSRSS